MGIRLISVAGQSNDSPTGILIRNTIAANAQFDNDIKAQEVVCCDENE